MASMRSLRRMAADDLHAAEAAAHRAGAAIGSTLDHAADRVRHAAGDVARRSARGVHDVQGTIAHHPLAAAFAAIGIGFLLATLTLRRRW